MPPVLKRTGQRRARQTQIEIAKRRQRPGTGSARPRPKTNAVLNWPDLTGVLQGIPWAVAGAVATRRYMPEHESE